MNEHESDAVPEGLASPGRGSGAELLELSRRLRQLAVHVARDEATADDLVQDAWLAALQAPPDRVGDLSRWLRGVVRNLARRRARDARARGAAEVEAAVNEAQPSENELVARVASYRYLRECVESLNEPSRTVIRMRYLEERAPPEIAELLHRPLETVRSQLQRGLDELRARLSRDPQRGPIEWLAGVLGWPRSKRHPVTALRSVTLLVAVVGTLIVGGLWWVASRRDASGERVVARPTPASQRDVELAQQDAEGAAAALPEQRVEDAADGPAGEMSVGASSQLLATRRLNVFVEDSYGALVAGATVLASGAGEVELARTETGADGRCQLTLDVARLLGLPILAAVPGGVSLVAFANDLAVSPEYFVAVPPEGREFTARLGGPAQALAVRVLDENGVALAGATVRLEEHVAGLRTLDDGTPYGEFKASASSDVTGVATLEHLPRREHRVYVRAAGCAASSASAGGDDDRLALDISLQRGAVVRGRILRGDGSPAALANVWRPDERDKRARELRTTADASGRFELTGLLNGAQRVFASDADDDTRCAELELVLALGEEFAWNPVLQEVAPLFVRVESPTGVPQVGAVVAMRTPRGVVPPWVALEGTDDAGRARFVHRPQLELECLAAAHAGWLPTTMLLEPGASGVRVLRLGDPSPAQLVRAQVVDQNGGVPLAVRVLAFSLARPWKAEVRVDTATGALEDLRLPPGAHQLFVAGPQGVFDAGIVEVAAGSELDVGALTTPAPRSVTIERASSSASLQLVAALATFAGDELFVAELAAGVRSYELWPGTYEVRGATAAGAITAVRFEVGWTGANRVLVP